MKKASLAFLLLLSTAPVARGDVVFLKGGQRIEGTVEEKRGVYEIASAEGTITVSKREVERIVRGLEALERESKVLHEKARALYREGIAIEGDAKARNGKLRKAVELLKEVGDMYHEAVEVYTGDEHADLPRTLVKIFQEIRIYRDQMVSELARAPRPKPSAPVPAPKPAPKARPAPAPATPAAPAAAPKPPVPAKKWSPAALLERAESGDPDGQVAFGIYLEEEKSQFDSAIKWYKKATRKLHPHANYRLALLYLGERGVPPNYKEALSRLKRAASTSYGLAQYRLGRIYFEGVAAKRSLREADSWCEKATAGLKEEADKGNLEALSALGWMYLHGLGVGPSEDGVYGPDVKKAVLHFTLAAEAGAPLAQTELAKLYDKGKLVARDQGLAIKWATKAAEQGYAEGQAFLGELHDDNFYRRNNPFLDHVKARGWYEKAAAQGNPQALYRLSAMYTNGEAGLKKDEQKSLDLKFEALKTARRKLKSQVINDIGWLYSNGQTVKKPKKFYLKYYQSAAELGLPMAQYNMGVISANDLGKFRDAIRWYMLASANNYGHASHNLGNHYSQGRGVKKNLYEAEKWYLMGVQQGWEPSKAALARVQDEIKAAQKRRR